jgi:hypothetical protein
MGKIFGLFAAPIVGALLFAAAPAAAQNTQSWVASTGSGVACTRAAPCANSAIAVNATVEGGTVSCVDRVQLVLGTIAKSITIDCEGSVVSLVAGGSIF